MAAAVVEISAQDDVDLSAFCRLCLQLPPESQVLDLNLIYDEEEQLTYNDCFTICTMIDLAADAGMPRNLCKSCGLELQVAYDFRKKVENSKRFLSQMKSTQIKAETEEEEKELEERVMLEQTGELSGGNSITSVEEVPVEQLESVEECEELEEHLEMDDYQTVEALEDDDAETRQNRSDESSFEEFLIETVRSSDNYEEQYKLALATNCSPNKSEPLPESVNTEEDSESNPEGHTVSNTQQESADMDVMSTHNKCERAVPSKRRHAGEYNCDYCHKLFPNHSRMLLHRRSHEPDRPKFPCADCGRIYATKQAMEVHVRTTHTKTGYPCPYCGKIYAIKTGLEVHMRYHTGDFPYVCDLCGKKFAQMCHLNTHTNVHHKSVRFCCAHPNCGKFFTSSASLRNHEFSHSSMPFECEFCSHGYPSKSKLKVHIRRKHGVELTLEELEPMRKFHVMRSKLSLVKVKQPEDK